MKKYFYLFIFISNTLYPARSTSSNQELSDKAPQGRVIFITGSCSAGKTSLSKMLAEELGAKFFAFDEHVMPVLLKKMIDKSIGKFFSFFLAKTIMRNFFSYVNLLSQKKKYEFQQKFYQELERGIAIPPTIQMYSQARNIALQGQDVVVEAPLHLGEKIDCLSSLSVLKDLDVVFVLAYCPWNSLAARIEQRNRSNDKKNRRELDWVFGNYLDYFNVSSSQDRTTIDSIDGKSIQRLIAHHTGKDAKKNHISILDETKQAMLKFFKTDEINNISPKLAYDVIVNTKEQSPKQGSEKVLEHIHTKASVKKFHHFASLIRSSSVAIPA